MKVHHTHSRSRAWVRAAVALGSTAAMMLAVVVPSQAATVVSQSTAQAVNINLLSSDTDIALSNPATSASSDGTATNGPNTNSPSISELPDNGFLDAGALHEEAQANADGSSFACAAIAGSGSVLQIGDGGQTCTVTGGTGQAALDLSAIPGVGGLLSGVANVTLTADSLTAHAYDSGSSTPTGDGAISGLVAHVTLLGGLLPPLDLPLTISPDPNQNLLTAIVNALTAQNNPLLSGLIDLLSNTLSGVVSLTANYQTTTPDGAFMVSALHVSLLNNAAAHADLASVTVGPNVPLSVPGAPIDLTATAGDGEVALSWTAPDDGGSPITGYNVYVGTAAGGESATPVNDTLVPGTTYTVTGLTNGTTYYFVVTAVNAVGESAQSNEASATPMAPDTEPGAPINLTATAGDGQVDLSWTVPDNDGGSPITGYNVYVGTAAGGESATPVNDTLVPGTTNTVTGLTNGTTYYFVVTAVNAVGESAQSNEASATPMAPDTEPGAPINLTATAGDGQVELTWTAPMDDGGSPVLGYNVYVGTEAGGESATPVNDTLVPGLTYTVTGLTNGTTYYFVVTAVNAVGESAQSNEASATPMAPDTEPGAPINLTATAGDGQVDLSWTAPDNDGGSPITGYNVYMGTEAGAESATPVNDTLVPDLDYTVTGLTNGTTYYFVVEAVNDVGPSDPSNEASATPEAEETVPGAPINLTAAAGDGYVNLSWTALDDGGSPILGYDVYMGTESGGEAATPVNGDTLVPGLGYQVTGLTNGTTYYFIVKAVNALGSSDPSNEASATPSGAECPAPFLDVPSTNPFCADITWMKDNGITNGYPDDTFRPVAPATRGQMAGFVYRQLNPGMPDPVCTAKPFSDIETDNPFCGDITWLKDNGITQGYDDGTFRPAAPISRQEIAAFMFRMNNQGQPDPSCTTAPFADVPITNPFCGDIEWMKDTGISFGGAGGKYFPRSETTRQAMAGLIHRMVSVL